MRTAAVSLEKSARDRRAGAHDPRQISDELSPDDAGRVTIYAATLPGNVDLDDEDGLILRLLRERLPFREANALLPHIVAKARELRLSVNPAPASDGGRDIASGVSS